ncbi:MAG: hypothetical protein NTX82_05055 [Candidatus Parcubacteria bacterium]|nr:hypothetical protein [Candidatus Parcubacteria bacterium]
MRIDEYAKLVKSGQTTKKPVTGICGRIIRGQKPSDFASLTDDPERKIVMLVDPDGLAKLLGKSGYDMLIEVGYQPDYLEHKVKEGNQFKLAVFPEGGAAQLATWDNIFAMVSQVYPDITFSSPIKNGLKSKSFAQIEKLAGFKFLDAEKAGKNDSRFMTYKRFLKSDQTLADFRAFLYFTIHLRELYSGDGWTYDDKGNRGVKEYIIPNLPIADLGPSELIDIDIQLPSTTSPAPKAGQDRRTTMKNLKIHLLIIDPQNDFMDIDGAALPVTGAKDDMVKLAGLINRVGRKLADIHVTLDSHRLIDIAHPLWWVDQNGNNPAPFTIINVDDVANRIWVPRNPKFYDRCLAYVRELKRKDKNVLCVWPPHCLIGTPGGNVYPELNDALRLWEAKEYADVDFVTKGSNPWTEHYGAMEAEVPDPEDPSTQLNTNFLNMLETADIVAIAGEALSHCVKSTVTQIADNIGEEHIKKFQILTDCTSPVGAVPGGPDFPAIAQQWLREIEKRGMTLTTSDDFLR